MKVLKGVTLVTTLVLALAIPGGAAGGVTTSVYTVASTTDKPGLSTGLLLKQGSVTVTATGTICYLASLCAGPDGDSSGVALIGRVGSGPWVKVGSGPTKLSGKGELVFAVSDSYFPDNTGSFEVTVSYKRSGVTRTCWPGWGWGDENHEHCGPPGQEKKTGQSSHPTHGPSNEHGRSDERGNPKK
jgi:hypothetical protein